MVDNGFHSLFHVYRALMFFQLNFLNHQSLNPGLQCKILAAWVRGAWEYSCNAELQKTIDSLHMQLVQAEVAAQQQAEMNSASRILQAQKHHSLNVCSKLIERKIL